jgi:hypothetical protein
MSSWGGEGGMAISDDIEIIESAITEGLIENDRGEPVFMKVLILNNDTYPALLSVLAFIKQWEEKKINKPRYSKES